MSGRCRGDPARAIVAALLDSEVVGAGKGHGMVLVDAPEPDEHEHEPLDDAPVGPAVAFDG